MNSSDGTVTPNLSTESSKVDTRNVGLDLLRIIAAFLVVLHHSLYVFGERSSCGWMDYLVTSLIFWVALCPVPIFVLISGAVACVRKTEIPVAGYYRKRLPRLVLPLLFWWTVYGCWSVLRSFQQGTTSFSELIRQAIRTPLNTPLWFLIMLICLTFFIPFIHKAVMASNRGERFVLVACGLATTLVMDSVPGSILYNYLLCGSYLLYGGLFLTGIVFSYEIKSGTKWAAILILLLIVLMVPSGYWYVRAGHFDTWKHLVYGKTKPPVLLFSLSMFLFFLRFQIPECWKGITRWLSSLTMGIFLSHVVFLRLFRQTGWNDQLALVLGPHTLPYWLGTLLYSLMIFVLSGILTVILLQIPYLRRIIQ